MLAWTKQNTMQRAMQTVLEWPQSKIDFEYELLNLYIENKPEPRVKNSKQLNMFNLSVVY